MLWLLLLLLMPHPHHHYLIVGGGGDGTTVAIPGQRHRLLPVEVVELALVLPKCSSCRHGDDGTLWCRRRHSRRRRRVCQKAAEEVATLGPDGPVHGQVDERRAACR
jgi:hypothetical protein